MAEVKVSVKDLVLVKYRILGMHTVARNPDGTPSDQVLQTWKGMINQGSLGEGVKRRLRKIIKAVDLEIADMEERGKQLLLEKEGEELKKAQEELDNDIVTLNVELCDFSKVEDLSFCEEDGKTPCDYELIYEKFFV